MTNNFRETSEDLALLRQKKTSDHSSAIFKTAGSAGANNVKLAQIVSVLDFAFDLLGWDDVSFTTILTANQASIEGRYHKDYKDIAVAVEKDMSATRKQGLFNL